MVVDTLWRVRVRPFPAPRRRRGAAGRSSGSRSWRLGRGARRGAPAQPGQDRAGRRLAQRCPRDDAPLAVVRRPAARVRDGGGAAASIVVLGDEARCSCCEIKYILNSVIERREHPRLPDRGQRPPPTRRRQQRQQNPCPGRSIDAAPRALLSSKPPCRRSRVTAFELYLCKSISLHP